MQLIRVKMLQCRLLCREQIIRSYVERTLGLTSMQFRKVRCFQLDVGPRAEGSLVGYSMPQGFSKGYSTACGYCSIKARFEHFMYM